VAVSRPNNGGFTLIEVLIAMSLFAIAATMVVPTMFAWVQANQLSVQRDRARQALDRVGDEYLQMGWASSAWSTAHDRFDAPTDAETGFDTTVDWTLPGGETVPRFYHIYAPAEFEREIADSGLETVSFEISSGNCYAFVRSEGKGP